MASYNPNNLSPDELSCPICFEEFSNLSSSENAPKLLLCLHTFCLGCIRSLVRSNKTIQCSICRTEHTDVSPQELFDNYVIMEYVRKQQEESDARLARQHSEHFMMDRPDQPGYQQRQEQLLRDSELARQYQELYDRERPNTGGAAAGLQPGSMIRDLLKTRYEKCVRNAYLVHLKWFEGSDLSTETRIHSSLSSRPPPTSDILSAPTVSVVQQPEVLCTAQESPPQPIVVASCSRPCRPPLHAPNFTFCRSASNSASSSSPSTSSVVTISSNTFSDSSSSSTSDDRCSSRQSSSSRLEEEFVDTVETLEVDEEDAGIAGAAAAVAGDVAEEEEDGDLMEASGSSSCTASALSPVYTDNSGFSHREESNDSNHNVAEDDYDDSHHSADDHYNEDEDRGSAMDDISFHDDDDDNGDGDDSDDMNSLHLGETFSEHIEDEREEDDLDGDVQQGSDPEEDQEDELFNNLSVLEAIDQSPEGPAAAPECHDIFSNDDSCISISSTESYSGIPIKRTLLDGQIIPMRRNFPLSVHSDLSAGDTYDLDDHLNSDAAADDTTITLNDSEDSTSNATNKTYNTRSSAENVNTNENGGRLNA